MKYLYIPLFALIFFSCKFEKSNTYNVISIEKKDSLEILIPTDINPFNLYWQFKDSIFYNSNFPFSEIYPYNIKNSKWASKITLTNEGPNGVGFSTGFFYKNNDSLFIINSSAGKVYLLNNENKVIKKYSFPNRISINPILYNQIKSSNNSLFIPCTEYIDFNKKGSINNAYCLLKLNLNTGVFKKIVKYPKEYHNKIWKTEHLMTPFIIHNNKIIVSFPISKELYIYNLDGELLYKKFAESKLIGNIHSLKNPEDDGNGKGKFNYFNDGFYSFISHNKFKKLFYRFSHSLPSKFKNGIPSDASINNLDLSVLIFDNELNYIGESFLPEDIGGFRYFIDRKGLNLSVKGKYINREIEKFITFEYNNID